MWNCGKCGEEVEDTLDLCWNCQASRSGRASLGSTAERIVDHAATVANRKFKPMNCLRCNQRIEYIGAKEFHEGANWGVLGDLAEVFVGHETLEMYHCPQCGHVEFFVFEK